MRARTSPVTTSATTSTRSGAMRSLPSSCSSASWPAMLEYVITVSGRSAFSAVTSSGSGVTTESCGAPGRPAWKAATSCFEMCSGLGAPIPDEAGLGGDADPREAAQTDGHPGRELLVRVREDTTEAGGPGRREQSVGTEVRLAGRRPEEVAFGSCEAQAGVGDDPVPLLHQRRLRQRRHGRERQGFRAPGRAEHLAVVRRPGGRVAEECSHGGPLMLEQGIARPAIACQELTGRGPEVDSIHRSDGT